MADKSKYPLVHVEWIDSKGVSGEWQFFDDLPPMPPTRCQTVGFLLDEQDDYITVAMSMSEDQVLARMTIPTFAITSLIEFKDAT